LEGGGCISTTLGHRYLAEQRLRPVSKAETVVVVFRQADWPQAHLPRSRNALFLKNIHILQEKLLFLTNSF